MALLGFDALGRLALGQLPKIDRGVSFYAWDVALQKKGLSAALIATTVSGYVPQPPQIAVAAPPVGGCFSKFSQPPPKVGIPAHLQPPPTYEVGFVGTGATPDRLVFSKFSQPPPISKVAVEQQPQPIFTILLGPASPPPWFVFAKFEPPWFSTTVKAFLQPSPLFEIFRHGDRTPGPLVFSTFSQPRFGPVSQSIETASALFEIRFTPRQTLVFTTFSQPRFSTTVGAHLQPQPWQQISGPIFPITGGSSRKLIDDTDRPQRKAKTGLEPVTKRPQPPAPSPPSRLVPPFKVIPVTAPAVEDPPMPGLGDRADEIARQMQDAIDASDIAAFLKGLDQDEQDAADIADVLALLDQQEGEA